jgi:hypothetical protein
VPQIMRGRDGSAVVSRALGTVQQLLQESFDPIIDSNVNVDLLPRMVYAQVGASPPGCARGWRRCNQRRPWGSWFWCCAALAAAD